MTKLTFLGTGTSHGVPVIGCHCAVCSSDNPKNKRTRCSVLVSIDGKQILIDTAPELRLQALAAGFRTVDAILFTHAHADHVNGIDDIRPFNYFGGGSIPCYGHKQTLETISQNFSYIFNSTWRGGGTPQVELHEVEDTFYVGDIMVEPILAYHDVAHRLIVLGYRFGRLAYLTDCKEIPEESLARLGNLEVLVLNALRRRPHPTHICLPEALEIVDRLNPTRAYFTHMADDLEHEATEATLPPGRHLAYDGLVVEV